MVDESSKVLRNEYTFITNGIESLVQRMNIGSKHNLVSVYGFDSQVNTKFDLDEHLTQADLISALQMTYFHINSYFARGDTSKAVDFLVNYATTHNAGDRPDYPDAIVFISDTVTSQTFHLNLIERTMLQHASQDIITVTVGTDSMWSIPTDQMATDGNHKLHVTSLTDPRIFVEKLLPLITKC